MFLYNYIQAQHNPNFIENHSGIVHLFEWKFSDIGLECENFLAEKGFGGVQVSPVNENIIISGRPWWERYQPLSYILQTRSGNEDNFLDMTKRCNAVGVRIYVDVAFNHMAADNPKVIGTAGSWADPMTRNYPAVPYVVDDFHPPCTIVDYQDPVQVRNCELVGLHDLNQTVDLVRLKVVDFLNDLISKGVAGFRVDAAKHMWPSDLKIIYDRLHDLNSSFGFKSGARPFIFQEVIDLGGEAVSKFEYNPLGVVTEFGFSDGVGRAFGGKTDLKYLQTMNSNWGFLPSKAALVFVDNHDNQRSNPNILTYKQSKQYKMATAFNMAYPFGIKRLMSSFAFDTSDQGPPADTNGNLISPVINPDGTCSGKYICEHRWHQVYSMVDFMNVVKDAPIKYWWDNEGNQIAFSRYRKGFVAFNRENKILNQTLQTSLPPGHYCDVISGTVTPSGCSGKTIQVNDNSEALILIHPTDQDGVIAIHVGSNSHIPMHKSIQFQISLLSI